MRPFSIALLAVVLPLLPACSSGPAPVKVSGKVNFNQQPLKTTEGVTIVFHPVVEAGKQADTYPATPLSEDGSFSVLGKDGAGIPPGKYKITVDQMTFNKAATAEMQKIKELFSLEKTQLVWDVTAETSITLDLSKPTGK